MAKQTAKDVYANIGAIEVVMSAANTLTFKELQSYVSVFDKKAFVIHKITYALPNGAWLEMDAETDWMSFGVSTSNQWSNEAISAVYNRPDVVDFNHVYTLLHGAAANAEIRYGQLEKDFSTLAGGGLLVPARPVYGYMNTGGFAALSSVYMRLYFTVVDVSVDEYWELVESTRIIS